MTFRFSLWLKVIVIFSIPFLLVACVRGDNIERDDLCKNSKNWDQCLSEIQSYAGSSSSCDRIWMYKKDEFRPQCNLYYALHEDNPLLCGEIWDAGMNNRCYMHFAKERVDYSYCYDMIVVRSEQKYNKIDPRWSCIHNIPKVDGPIGFCNSNDNAEQRRDCYYFYAAYYGKIDICEEVSQEVVEEDNCYYEAASHAENVNFCDYVSKQELRENCYYNIISRGKHSCLELSNEDSKLVCEQIFEDLRNDTMFQICLESDDVKQCFTDLSVNKKDLKWCSYLEDDAERRFCYEVFAEKIDDLSYCSTGITEFARSFCEVLVVRNKGNDSVVEEYILPSTGHTVKDSYDCSFIDGVYKCTLKKEFRKYPFYYDDLL